METELGVGGAASFCSLPEEVAVFVGVEVAPDVEDEDYEEGGGVA